MVENILATEAPKYWEKGMSVMPLKKMDKVPLIFKWQVYHDTPIPEDQKNYWVNFYPDNNIGLVLGKQSDVTIIDIDTDDQNIIDAILKVLPPTPWVRIGRKGMALAYKFSNLPTFRLDTAEGKRIVEYLSSRTQVVLPPSIHPDTRLPYTANCNLYDVLDKLEVLPQNLEDLLRVACSTVVEMQRKGSSKFRYSDKISLGARDTKMNQHAGFAATKVLSGEQSLIQSMNNMLAWAEENVERKSGDDLDLEKGVRQIIGYVLSDVNTKGRILPTGWDDGLTAEQKIEWGLNFDDTKEAWNVSQALAYITNVFSELGKDNPNKVSEVEYVLKKVRSSKNLTSLDLEQIYSTLQNASGIKKSAFKERLKEMDKGEIEGGNHTEIALDALKELEKKGYLLRFHHEGFWAWEGTNWAPMDKTLIMELIAREYGHLPAAKKAADHKGILTVMSNVCKQGIEVVKIDGVNFRNGFLTEDLRLIPHSPDFGMTYTMPFAYKPELASRAFKFEQMMHTSWGKHSDYEDKKRALQEAMAVTLFGKGPMFQRAILLYGAANCGKSQYLKVITALVPPEARATLPPDKWGDKYSTAVLDGKVLNIAGELDKHAMIPGAAFKELVDGTPRLIEEKYKSPTTFTPKATHWFASNWLPKSKDTSKGFFRRWLILHFDREPTGNEKVLDIGDIVVNEEIEAVVSWAIQAYPDVVFKGELTLPASHHHYVQEVALGNSTLRQWLSTKTCLSPDKNASEDDLYRSFFTFCSLNGQTKILQKQNFLSDLDQILAEDGRKGPIFEGNKRIYRDFQIL